MPRRPSIAVPTARVLARGAERLAAAARHGEALLGAYFGAALSPDERLALTIALFDGRTSRRPLFDWEAAWFSRDLPAAPARLLVGGAGAGPEVAAVLRAGHVVDALEPAPRSARACRTLGPDAVFELDYAQMADGVLDGSGPGAVLHGRRYDAMILGWGSFTHVLLASDRARVLSACARLTDGPVLLSVWMSEPTPGPAWAGRLGALSGRLRGLQPSANRESFGLHCGFGHCFVEGEIDHLAAGIGRRAVWGEGPYPHVTLSPRAASR